MSTNFKSIKAERTTETRNTHDLETQGTGNIFETIVALAKRSNQVAQSLKTELSEKLEEFVIPTDSLEEVFENREQIEISKYYERLPKPHSIAIKELEEALQGDDKDAIQAKLDALTEASGNLAQKMYAEQADAGQQAGDAEAGAGAKKEDDVVDAEYEEVNDDQKKQ